MAIEIRLLKHNDLMKFTALVVALREGKMSMAKFDSLTEQQGSAAHVMHTVDRAVNDLMKDMNAAFN